ncbi:hypothetical protein [Pseudomonas akapageensis]|uniref:hypothetical protein n=1 Tax=Pseudomonas akapageensis TaxID=2609961 RepID=UPI001408B458|nr:hypothetical protein [Pseudomonas akapageensis]
MHSTRNQKIEKTYFDSFRQHYALPTGEIEHDDKPDVLIHGEGQPRMLGVEIARLYKIDGQLNQSEQQQIVKRITIIELAERIYLSRGGRKIALGISFDPQYPIMRKKHMTKIANDLASYALEISSLRNGHQSHSPLEDTPELSWLYHDGKEYPNSTWGPVQSYDVPALLVTRVKELVAQKTQKIQAYEPCGAYWLLLIVDFWDQAQDQSIHWPADENIGQTPFERILIYKTCFNEVVEVSQRGVAI